MAWRTFSDLIENTSATVPAKYLQQLSNAIELLRFVDEAVKDTFVK